MNNKGFTLIELVATLVVLGLVTGLGLYTLRFNMDRVKAKTEEVFVDTLRDAVDMYLSAETANLVAGNLCSKTIQKKHNSSVKVYEVTKSGTVNIKFSDIINSKYKPLVESEFVNPANKDVDGKYQCSKDAEIDVYRDEDYVYYYYIDKRELKCLNNTSGDYSSIISNLPDGFTCR